MQHARSTTLPSSFSPGSSTAVTVVSLPVTWEGKSKKSTNNCFITLLRYIPRERDLSKQEKGSLYGRRVFFVFSQERMRCKVLLHSCISSDQETGVLGPGPRAAAPWSKDVCSGVVATALLNMMAMCWGGCSSDLGTPNKVHHTSTRPGLPQQAGSRICGLMVSDAWRVWAAFFHSGKQLISFGSLLLWGIGWIGNPS